MAKSSWFAVALLIAASAHAQIQFKKLAPEQIEKRLDAAATTQAERGAYLRQEFQAAGCADVKDDPVAHEKQPNIVCVMPGKTSRQIVVGAHYDFVSEGRGIVDNWSGAALLPSFVESLKTEPREHTFVFIAFTGEEDGMVGSKSFVAHLSKEQRQNVAMMVNLDTLGLSTTKVWTSHSSKALVNALFSVASSTNSPLAVMNADGVAKTDSDSFRDANIPEICVHSVTQDTFKILHSRNDQMSAIRRNDYYETYRLMASYLAAIDASLDSAEPKK
jgi:Zn-dependent M28 family amino/carboxypeptidase